MKPQTVDRASLAFGGDVKKLLPPYESIPDEFRDRRTYWNQLVSKLFFDGGSLKHLTEKPGIDRIAAINHIRACLASWEPKHEHKEAGCAYLFSLWFEEPKTENHKPATA